jgi:hypothetical protein
VVLTLWIGAYALVFGVFLLVLGFQLEVVNGPLGGRNASQAHPARSDSDSPVDHDDDCRTPARHDPPLRRRWRLCQQLYKIYASLSKELLAPWGGVEFTNGKRFGTNLPQAGIDLGENEGEDALGTPAEQIPCSL